MNTCKAANPYEHHMSQPLFPARQQRTVEYAALPTAVGAARREVVQTLKDWGLVMLIDPAELLTSELVTNAVKATGLMMDRPRYTQLHGVQRVLLQLRVERHVLLLLVWDNDPTPPIIKRVGLDDEGGRGLQLVQAMSSHWGYYLAGKGKVVWCELTI